MTKTAAILAAVLLAGCATSPASMEQPQNASSFTVDAPYQEVLKRLVESEQNCQSVQLAPIGQRIDDVQHYPDLREAKIVRGAQGMGRQINHVVHVREAGEGAEVILYTKAQRDRKLAAYKRWANGDPACP